MKIGYFTENGKDKGEQIILIEDIKEAQILSNMITFAADHKDNKRKKTYQKLSKQMDSDLAISKY